MAIALTTGGPGALVWMWVMAFLGAAIQYASCLLGVKYRMRNKDNELVGGPMYYLTHGLGLKSLGILFSLILILAAFAVGNFAQVNSIVLPLQSLGIPKLVSGFVMAFFVALVILGGLKRMAKVSSAVVPVMALFYIGTAWIIIGLYAKEVIPAFSLMFKYAFSTSAVGGGILGYTVLKALTTGFDRAIFATDAGTGTVPILQSSARTHHAAASGVVTLIAPFLVMIVCTTTALVLIVTGAFGVSELQSTNLVAYAFEKGVGNFWGSLVITISLTLFGYTTTLAWASCMDRGVEFLFGKSYIRIFQFLYVLAVPLGSILYIDFVWVLADICLTFLLILNLIGVVGLSKEVIGESSAYFNSSLKTSIPELE